MANRWGNSGNSERLYFGGAPKSLQMVTAAMKLKDTPWKKSFDQPRQHITKQRHYSAVGLHTKENRIERDTCTPMFNSALFIIARTWKQPRCPSADKWIRKL